jgi:hypothetical protein
MDCEPSYRILVKQHRMKPLLETKPWLCFYLGANLLGLFLYWFFIHAICNDAKTEQRDYYDFGDSLNYIGTALPVFALCLVLNIGWGIKALSDILRRRDYHAVLALLVVMAILAVSYPIIWHSTELPKN